MRRSDLDTALADAKLSLKALSADLDNPEVLADGEKETGTIGKRAVLHAMFPGHEDLIDSVLEAPALVAAFLCTAAFTN